MPWCSFSPASARFTRTRAYILGALVLGCESEASPSAASDVGDGTEPSTSISGAGEVPADCSAEESPFLRGVCLDALRDRCRENEAESSCAAADPLKFDNNGYVIRCRWAKVVTFTESDGVSCEVTGTEGRCEATVDTVCSDGCAGDYFQTNLRASPMQREIVQVCGGPLGAWSAVGAEPGEYFACAPNTLPPPPALCDCAPIACEAN